MGRVCTSGMNQAINNPTGVGEKIFRISSVHREIEGGFFKLSNTKSDTLNKIALDEQTIRKVHTMTEEIIEKDM